MNSRPAATPASELPAAASAPEPPAPALAVFDAPQSHRYRVIGDSGAGKTTFARALAAQLGVPHRELDEVFWAENWTMRDRDEARAELRAFFDSDEARLGWVIDGNWNNARQGVGDEATLVWLDFSRSVIMRRVIWRTLRRAVLSEELWHGNKERIQNIVDRRPEENIILFAWTAYDDYRAKYLELGRCSTVRMIRLCTPRAAKRWLDAQRPVVHVV